MAIPIFVLWLGGAVAAAVAVSLWDRICAWFADHANPWLNKHVPSLQPYLEKAFKALDKVVSAVRRTVIEAWRRIRPYLLDAIIEFERRTHHTWIRRITTFLRQHLEGTPTRVVQEEEIDWVDIPEDARQRILERSKSKSLDFIELREQELAMVTG